MKYQVGQTFKFRSPITKIHAKWTTTITDIDLSNHDNIVYTMEWYDPINPDVISYWPEDAIDDELILIYSPTLLNEELFIL